MGNNTAFLPQECSSKLLKHLGLVAGMYDELGLGELIDSLISQDDEQRLVSVGQSVKAMVLNGLGFANRALYLTPHFFQDKPVDRLIGEGIEDHHLNDTTLGRNLDCIYEYGLEKLYSQLAAQAVGRLGLRTRFGHLDSTSFHTDGRYQDNGSAEEEGVIRITKGYSRDHRPDLNQVVLQLICERQAGIPLLMKPLSGNSSDKTNFRETVQAHIDQMKNDFSLKYLVADSALYTAKTLKELSMILWISRVPETLSLSQEIIHAVASDLMQDSEKATSRSLGVVYGDVRQRWLVVYSPEAYQRGLKTVNKKCLKLSTNESKEFDKLCKQNFACEADALKALSCFENKLKILSIHDTRVVALPRHKGKRRPAKGKQPRFHVYRIEGNAASLLQERTRLLERKSCFILATNQLDCEELSDEELLKAYKDQQKVERGFRFLKDPLFMASTLFLKSRKRIMALMMVMTLCLLVYAHTHIAAYTTSDCTGVTVPFGTVFGSGYDFSSNGSLYQWHGTEISSGNSGTTTCPVGNGLYCGTIDSSLNNDTLYYCQNGNYQVREQCSNGCEVMPSGTNDRCMSAPASCPNGDGLYCGTADSSLNNNTLYYCQGGNYQVREQCSNGCEVMPSGTNDRCEDVVEPPASCPGGDGLYCGTVDSSLNNNTLYYCQSGNYQVREQCSNGCETMPSGTNDR
ncbi:MAG: IS1634 family transposase, partial [Candidatus Electrothrix sp. AR4]|nr:IS1634 family transposase [Candidatus Electrothrix sp. AR4]